MEFFILLIFICRIFWAKYGMPLALEATASAAEPSDLPNKPDPCPSRYYCV
jgi:hypothetical protein